MQYNIRHATPEDDDLIVICARNAFEESPYVGLNTFSEERVRKTIEFLRSLGKNKAIMLVAETPDKQIVGLFGAMVSFTTMGLEETAMEVLWWVHPIARKTRLSITLIDAFEFWAGKLGITKLVLGSMENSHANAIQRFYEKKGYKFTERTYFKEIENGSSN